MEEQRGEASPTWPDFVISVVECFSFLTSIMHMLRGSVKG